MIFLWKMSLKYPFGVTQRPSAAEPFQATGFRDWGQAPFAGESFALCAGTPYGRVVWSA